MRLQDLTGNKFNRWTVLNRAKSRGSRTYWNCICECGNLGQVYAGHLKSGHSKSCGCIGNELKRKEFGESSFKAILSQYKRNANKSNRLFELSELEFKNLITDSCHYCKSEPKTIYNHSRLYGHFVYNGIDRKDNDIGYIKDNCVPCCFKCNSLKGKMNYYEFLELIRVIYQTRIHNGQTTQRSPYSARRAK